MIIKILAFGLATYLRENGFNTGIVIVCLADMLCNILNLGVMGPLRVLCGMRLAMLVPLFDKSIMKILKKIAVFFIILLLVICTFSLLGHQLFANSIQGIQPLFNFETLLNATTSTILAQNTWTTINSNYPSPLFFLTLTAASHFLACPLLAAAVLNETEETEQQNSTLFPEPKENISLFLFSESSQKRRLAERMLNFSDYPIALSVLVSAVSLAVTDPSNTSTMFIVLK